MPTQDSCARLLDIASRAEVTQAFGPAGYYALVPSGACMRAPSNNTHDAAGFK